MATRRARSHGNAHGYTWTDWKDTSHAQDDVPLRQVARLKDIVRAMYYYTGAADVAAINDNVDYLNAMKRVWKMSSIATCISAGYWRFRQ